MNKQETYFEKLDREWQEEKAIEAPYANDRWSSLWQYCCDEEGVTDSNVRIEVVDSRHVILHRNYYEKRPLPLFWDHTRNQWRRQWASRIDITHRIWRDFT